jgi:hypothetical protein
MLAGMQDRFPRTYLNVGGCLLIIVVQEDGDTRTVVANRLPMAKVHLIHIAGVLVTRRRVSLGISQTET